MTAQALAVKHRVLTTDYATCTSSNFRPLDLSLSWVARPTGLKTVLTMSLLSRPGRYSAPTAARAGAGGEEAADGSSSAEDGGAAKEGGVGVEAREVGRCGGCCCYCGGETSRERAVCSRRSHRFYRLRRRAGAFLGQVAEGVASVVGGVAVACVRAAAAVAGAVGYAAPLLHRLATRLQEAVSRRLPPPPLPRTDLGGSRCAGAAK